MSFFVIVGDFVVEDVFDWFNPASLQSVNETLVGLHHLARCAISHGLD